MIRGVETADRHGGGINEEVTNEGVESVAFFGWGNRQAENGFAEYCSLVELRIRQRHVERGKTGPWAYVGTC